MHWLALVQVWQLAGQAVQVPSGLVKKPGLQEQVPSPLLEAPAVHTLHESGPLGQLLQPVRQTGTRQRGPVHSGWQVHEQSLSWMPLPQVVSHTHWPVTLSQWPWLGRHEFESHCTSQWVPKKLLGQLVHSKALVQVAHAEAQGVQVPSHAV